jgi:hypothetical protein
LPTTQLFTNQKASGNSGSLDVSQVSDASIFVLDSWQGSIRFMASIDGGNTFPIPVAGVDRRTNQPVEDLLGSMIPPGGLQIKFPVVKDYNTLRMVLQYVSGAVYATGYADTSHAAATLAGSITEVPVTFTGSATSAAVNLTSMEIMQILVPGSFGGGGTLTLLTSDSQGGIYLPLYDDQGNQIAITIAAGQNTAIVNSAIALASLGWTKFVAASSNTGTINVLGKM